MNLYAKMVLLSLIKGTFNQSQIHVFSTLCFVTVTQEEWRSHNTIEIEINQTLKIPCLQNISSGISSEFTFAWLVVSAALFSEYLQ